jgi:hypothetical protein
VLEPLYVRTKLYCKHNSVGTEVYKISNMLEQKCVRSKVWRAKVILPSLEILNKSLTTSAYVTKPFYK